MTTNEVGRVRSSPTGGGGASFDFGLPGTAEPLLPEVLGGPFESDWLGATNARFVLESDGLACCMTCGVVSRPWLVRLPDAGGAGSVVARCVACGTRGTVHPASHWVRVTRAPNPSPSIA